MDLVEAIKSRTSIRGYKPDPVPEKVLEELLDVARWSPSGVNGQSWEFVVLTGDVLEAVKRANVEQMDLGVEPHPYLDGPTSTGHSIGSRDRNIFIPGYRPLN